MGSRLTKLKEKVLGTPAEREFKRKRRIAMQRKVEQARYEGYTKGRIEAEKRRAYQRGRRAAVPMAERVGRGIVGAVEGISGSIGGPYYRPERRHRPRTRQKHRHRSRSRRDYGGEPYLF